MDLDFFNLYRPREYWHFDTYMYTDWQFRNTVHWQRLPHKTVSDMAYIRFILHNWMMVLRLNWQFSMGGDLHVGGTVGTPPNLRWGTARVSVPPPNILRSTVMGFEAKYE